MDEPLKQQRRTIIDVAHRAKQGHLSSSMSVVEMLNILYKEIMHFHPASPDADANDRLVLSKGHASLALYVLLYEMGCISKETLYSFSQFDSILGEHPDRNKIPGVDVSTGSLGHGFPCAVGMAIGFKAQNKPNRVYAIIGDGEANEGSIWEAAHVAAELQLDNIVCIADDNDSASHMPNLGEKFRAFGWETTQANGNDITELRDTLSKRPDKPYFVWAHTVKGFGCPLMEKDPEGWHHRVVSDEEYDILMKELQ